jgi:type IV pilus assembly protein PilB
MHLPVPPERLKSKLIQDKLITPEEFDALAAEAERKNQSFLDTLLAEKGIDQDYLYELITGFLGVARASFDVAPLDEQLVKLLPEDIARKHQAIVFKKEADGALGVAMANPSDLDSIQFLTRFLKARVVPYLAVPSDLNRGFSVYGLQTASDFKRIIQENVQASLRSQKKTAEESAAELPIVAIVENFLTYAASLRASDIHIEALEEETLVRYRVDGILYEVMRVPKAVHPALVARLKLLSGLKIDEHFKPQDGRFRHQIVNQVIDVRVSVMPTSYGEKVEMRLLESSQKPLSLEELGMLPDVAKKVADNLKKSYGMILSTGPTGSGKSTTLYAILTILNKPSVNIVTIEDPVEYNVRYVNQSQINTQAGITFASGLRSLLRQDPNVIMVGEIRDNETADIAVQAALTGHLLLSTLHTNDAATAIPRLFDLGVPPFLVSSVLNIIVAQRLLRKVCPVCIYSYTLDRDAHAVVTHQLQLVNARVQDASVPKILYRGKGCPNCSFTGYRGRLGIFEVLELTDTIKALITDQRFSLSALQNAARENGMKSMFEDGLLKAQLGMTTLEEILRVMKE